MTTPDRTAERMRSVAEKILASERPSASRVAAELREILSDVEAGPAGEPTAGPTRTPPSP